MSIPLLSELFEATFFSDGRESLAKRGIRQRIPPPMRITTPTHLASPSHDSEPARTMADPTTVAFAQYIDSQSE